MVWKQQWGAWHTYSIPDLVLPKMWEYEHSPTIPVKGQLQRTRFKGSRDWGDPGG